MGLQADDPVERRGEQEGWADRTLQLPSHTRPVPLFAVWEVRVCVCAHI